MYLFLVKEFLDYDVEDFVGNCFVVWLRGLWKGLGDGQGCGEGKENF